MRFYIAIEDGSAQLKRDLGEPHTKVEFGPLGQRKATSFGEQCLELASAFTERAKSASVEGSQKATENAVLARRAESAWSKQKRLTNSAFIQRARQKWTARRVGAAIGDHIQALSGRMRCMTADLIVVDKLVRLYDCLEDEMLCYVLVVIGRGASVVTLLAWNLAARNPNKVALDERDSASAIGDTRISRRAMQTIDTAEEARKTTPKHEFICLHDVGRLRERYKSGLE